MNTNELRAERVRQNKSTEYMGELIGKTKDSYSKKERGDTKFSTEEMKAIAIDFNMSFALFNTIFFDGNLPYGKFSDVFAPEA